VAHQAFEALGVALEPIHEIAAITCAGSRLAGGVYERKHADGFIGRLFDLRRRPAQDVFVNGFRELLAVAVDPV